MIKTTSENGRWAFTGATVNTPFSAEDFYSVDMSHYDGDQQWALHTDLGSLTVLDRMTGFGYRDIETGYRAMNGDFWLASGGFDVRDSESKTLGEAIDWVKKHANNCYPGQ